MEKLLVTGATGLVGASLCHTLLARGISFVPCVRKLPSTQSPGPAMFETGDLSVAVDWTPALAGCTVVVHLAARVHMMQEQAADPEAVYRAMNVDATMRLAEQAAAQGVRRFIFVSSVKVNGEHTLSQPFRANDPPAPEDAYGRSKLAAELALQAWAARTGTELVIVRPPLVYGPGVRANFLRLMQLVKSGVPLPLGNVRNSRSVVALGNLVDFLLLCASHPGAAGATWMVSDNRDLSLPELITLIATAMGRPARLLPVPTGLLAAGASLLGRRAAAGRLLDSLQVDVRPALDRLGWTPPLDVETGIRLAVAPLLNPYPIADQ
ncbi:UDP-glucose 4-epimerase family protein [Noviherbaspirillum suwonense]|nr:SDR family oxidoreductase [Noviherbaspirillum suwonense]